MFFFKIAPSIAEAAVVIPNGAKIFFANDTAILLNKDPKNPPD